MSVANGFLALDDCDIYLATSRGKNGIEETVTRADNPWFDVEIPCSRDTEKNDNPNAPNPNTDENTPKNCRGRHRYDEDHCCPWCHLVLEADPSPTAETKRRQALKLTTTGMFWTDDTNDNSPPRLNGRNNSNGAPRYDGTIQDTKCKFCSRSHSRSQQRQRSDAALMIGLALMAQDYEHITIQSIKVGLHKSNKINGNSESSSSSSSRNELSLSFKEIASTSSTELSACADDKNHRCYHKQQVCLLITFTCRELAGIQQQQKRQSSPRRIGPTGRQRRRFFTDSTKSLPAATQLLLSIMSSDWREYDAKIASLPSLSSMIGEQERGKWDSQKFTSRNRSSDKSNDNVRKSHVQKYQHRTPVVSFFPSRMNLEDVFQRIGGVSSSSLLSNVAGEEPSSRVVPIETHKTDGKFCESSSGKGQNTIDQGTRNMEEATTSTRTRTAKLDTLPTDILCHRIGKYLRAKCLDALRCTCKHLHWTLRSVVPGLKLNLYSHQIKSLVWMRERETKQITEDDLLKQNQRLERYSSPQQRTNESRCETARWIRNDRRKEGDVHRAATGGGTVVLCERKHCHEEDEEVRDSGHVDESSVAVRISQSNFCEVIHHGSNTNSTENPLSRKVARGGLLCDDPGLGKTITVISLILQTMGLTTGLTTDKDIDNDKERKVNIVERTSKTYAEQDGVRNTTQGNCDDDETTLDQRENILSPSEERIFYEYWKEQIIPEFRCQALTKLFSTFLRSSPEINLFFDNYWLKVLQPKAVGAPSYPLSLKDIRRRADKYNSLEEFVSDVEACFRNAISSNLASDSTRQAAKRLLVVFKSQIIEFKRSQIQVAIKSFSRASAKPDSIVAALVEKTNSEKLKNALVASSATLLVVPAVLVDHWMEQLKLNVDVAYCTYRTPLIFEYTGSNKTELKIEETISKCHVNKTHFPFIFVDRTATKKLPPPSFLAMFKIVITTNNRFSSEWKNGSFEDEMRRNRNQDSKSNGSGRWTDFREDLASSEEACPLLKVNWLRMIVDEGHSMGRGKDNSSISFASWINSERRWAMTGTPTPQTSTQSGLANVFNLMQYLQHEFFTRRYDGDTIWNQLVIRSWNRGFVSAFFRLRSLLSLLMIRHVKSDILELPLPVFSINTLSMGYEEVSTYNTLVCAIQSNLVITSMKGKTSGAQDSLLHKSQTRHAREAIGNLRLVCAGGTQVRPTLSDEYWTEFHQDFDDCNSDPIQRKKIRGFIQRATSGRQSKCDCCSVVLSTLLVFPCGHLVCTECVDSDTTSCLVCDEAFDVDAFQRLQPGFKYDWLHNVEEETNHRPVDASGNANGNANGKTDGSSGDEVSVLPGGHGVLIPHNQRRRRARSRKFGDGHACEYDPKSPDGKCVLCFTEHEPCYLAGEKRCRVCYRTTQNCPASESKITHIIDKLLGLYDRQKQQQQQQKEVEYAYASGSGRCRSRTRTPKVIVFSQFRKVLNITGDRLLRRFGSGCIAEYWGKYRRKELNKFVRDENCLCMLLGKDGSEGLDLSFVTHIIFLEQVWDKSLENQVVARAWRMGARGSVDVETLVAENSIEETMFLLENQNENQNQPDHESSLEGDDSSGVRNASNGTSSSSSGVQNFRSTAKDQKSSEYQQAKVHYLLHSLKLIVDKSNLGFVGNNNIDGKPDGSLEHTDSSSKRRRQHFGTVDVAQIERAKRPRVRFET